MHLLPVDERLLQNALELARSAVGLASPNPTVGCVLARGETVTGQGAHVYDRFDHAEIVALKQAEALGHSVSGATAYVTLEPCSHHGRTGPCADALVAARIARCVVATVDPNPKVRGEGIAKLRAAGVEVMVLEPSHVLAREARQLNDAFAQTILHHRPFVTLKAALSVDGKIGPPAAGRKSKEPHWLTGPAARVDVQMLRHANDAILTGIGTVLADDPTLTDRTGLPRRRPLLRVVLDADLRIPLDSKLVTSAANDLLVICHPFAPEGRERQLRERGVEVERHNGESERPGLPQTLETLAERKINSLLLEAGSQVNANFLLWELVDKAVLYYSESELGLKAVPFADGGPSPFVLQERLTQTTHATFPHGNSEDIRITGYIHNPWAGI